MLELRDIFQLPQVEPLIEQLVTDGPGLTVVAGLDARPEAGFALRDHFLPSGRAAIFRILMREILVAHPGMQAALVADRKDAIRIPRSLRRRVQLHLVPPSGSYAETIAHVAERHPDLMVIDRLSSESAAAALAVAGRGIRVLSQLDTVFWGAAVARHLLDLGVGNSQLCGLTWVVAVQRRATLCPKCRRPTMPDAAQLSELRRRFPDSDDLIETGSWFQATGCRHCRDTGREGETTAFDIYRAGREAREPLQQSSVLPLETYLLGLAAQGHLPLEEVLQAEANQLWQTYRLMLASERAFIETRRDLTRKELELETANRVLQQRTEALVSLEGIGQALITSTGLDELAAQLCRSARDLCSADRSILYFLHREEGMAEVLAECGWDPSVIHQPLEAAAVFEDAGTEPSRFDHWPPGVPHYPTDVTAAALRAGLRVPMVAQGGLVGLMVVHTSQKPRFTPGDVALLQTFANQAAVAIQRSRLVEALQEKIVQLEAAQAELMQKERMEREMELARQVQQSVLPHIFPPIPGYDFAAYSEPARWVGGDFYDVIPLDSDRFVLVVGDVSDKGMPAALYMTQTHGLLHAEARREDSPCAVLQNVHRLLQELGRSGMFVTVFFGIVEQAARRLTYARAGHNRPLLLREGQVLTLGGEGTVIGFPDMESLYLSEEQIDLNAGDILVLYTDGLIDAVAPDGQPFELERLVSSLKAHAGLPPAELCMATFADVTAYQKSAEQFDDMTMLIAGVL
jgi:serine phosphatase RsbU (regulator of sigma subunit)